MQHAGAELLRMLSGGSINRDTDTSSSGSAQQQEQPQLASPQPSNQQSSPFFQAQQRRTPSPQLPLHPHPNTQQQQQQQQLGAIGASVDRVQQNVSPQNQAQKRKTEDEKVREKPTSSPAPSPNAKAKTMQMLQRFMMLGSKEQDVGVGGCALSSDSVGAEIEFELNDDVANVSLDDKFTPQVTPITMLTTKPVYQSGSLVAANGRFVCYAVRGGQIRVIDISNGSRDLLRQLHGASILDATFFVAPPSTRSDVASSSSGAAAAQNGNVLASVAADGSLALWRILAQPNGHTKHRALLHYAPPSDGGAGGKRVFQRVVFHPRNAFRFVTFGNDGKVYSWDVEAMLSEAADAHVAAAGGGEDDDDDDDDDEQPLVRLAEPRATIVDDGQQQQPMDVSFAPDGNHLAVAAVDGTVTVYALDFDRPVVVHRWSPHGNAAVFSVRFVDSSTVLTGAARNSTLALWRVDLSQGVAPSSVSSSFRLPQRLQSIRFTSHDGSTAALYNVIALVVPECSAVFVANPRTRTLFSLHVARSAAAGNLATSFDWITEYNVPFPVMSLIPVVHPSKPDTLQLFTVQAVVVLLYQVPVSALSEAELIDDGDGGGGDDDDQVESDQVADDEQVADGSDSELQETSEGGPDGEEDEDEQDDDDDDDDEDEPSEQDADDVKDDDETDTTATEQDDDDEDQDEEDQDAASSLKADNVRLQNTTSPLLPPSAFLHEAKAATPSPVIAVATVKGTEATMPKKKRARRRKRKGGAAAADSPSPGAIQILSRGSSQVQPSDSEDADDDGGESTVDEDGGRVGDLDARFDRLYERLSQDRAEQQRADRDFQQRLLATVSSRIDKAVQREIATSVMPALSRNIATSLGSQLPKLIEPVLATIVKKVVVPRLEKLVGTSVAASVSRSMRADVTQQIPEAVREPIADAVSNQFQSAVIPSFEAATRTMFEQIDGAFQTQFRELLEGTVHVEIQRATDAALQSLSTSTRNLSTVTEQMSRSAHDTQRYMMEASAQAAAAAAAATSPVVVHHQQQLAIQQQQQQQRRALQERQRAQQLALQQQQQQQQKEREHELEAKEKASASASAASSGAASLSAELASAGVTVQVLEALRQALVDGRFEEAFRTALSANNLNLVMLLCSTADVNAVFKTQPPRLSQPVTLSLIQQLAFDLDAERADIAVKLTWLHAAAEVLDPAHAHIADHVPEIVKDLRNKLRAAIPKLSGETSNVARGLMHLVNFIQTSL
jgi:WD40 repeat protein